MWGSRCRIGLLLGLVVFGVVVPWIIWGSAFEAALNPEGLVQILGQESGRAAAIGLGLIVADCVLPIPATPVMSGLGLILGPWLGGAVAALGSFLSGCVAYGLARFLGRAPAAWIAGPSLPSLEASFVAHGGWMVALSRWAPVLPETVAALAGVVRMPFARFALALACGSLPMGFIFAAIGHLGHASPAGALLLSALLPAVLWLGVARWFTVRASTYSSKN